MADNKIIVDEDWKSQVQAEKEAAQKGTAAQGPRPQTGESPAASASAGEAIPSGEAMPGDEESLPAATLSSLIVTLATQAWLTLGQIPDPQTGKGEVHLPYARHVIDMLEMLEQKTHGNRTPEEISLLSRTLHELRMAYVAVEREVAKRPAGK
jgi:hypothetical protein